MLDIIYPRHCVGCDTLMPRDEKGFLCSDCYSKIRLIENFCPKCAAEVNRFASIELGCNLCKNTHFAFDGAISAARYGGIIRVIMHKFKFGGDRVAGLPLANLLIDTLRESPFLSDIDVIASVPLSSKRFHKRGFNQAEFIGKRVAKVFNLPFSSKNLVRVKETRSQSELSPKEKQSNVKDAFKVRRGEQFSSKSVLLVDDVLTTGNTLSECARVLKRAGASKVFAATVLRWQV